MSRHFAPNTVTPATIAAARANIARFAWPTPLETSPELGALCDAQVWLKLECHQVGGSFKIRGAANRLAHLNAAERAQGIVAVSAGNHALGVAHAACAMDIPTLLIVPTTASPAKLAALHRFNPALIELRPIGADYDEAEQAGLDLAVALDRPFISAYNDPHIIAGQGTIAPEILEDQPDLDLLLIPVGGGGLAAGIGVWMRHATPQTRLVGIQSAASPTMYTSFAAGHLVESPVLATLADGLAGNIEPDAITFPLCQATLDEIVLVNEDEIAAAIRWMVDTHHLIVEGSGAVGIAALLAKKLSPPPGSRIGIVITGRNIATDRLRAILEQPS